MAAAGKDHRKRKSGRKADKKKSKDAKKRMLGAGGTSVNAGGSSGHAGSGAAAAMGGLRLPSGGNSGSAAAAAGDRKGKGSKGKGSKGQPKAKGDPGANPRAFAFQSAGRAKASQARSAEKEQRRLHAPLQEKLQAEPPPLLVLVHGPPKVGKTSLIKGLVKHYTKQNLADPLGPITLVTGKHRRITLLECPPDLPGMMDAAKAADLVLLMIDGSFGLEMETFEFLNLLQVHGFPKVMGVLTHLDAFKEPSKLKKAKKALKARFWSEVYDGAKLFYLSGMQHGKYLKREVLNLARFISVAKTRPLTWRLEHPYLIADRFEDVTPPETVRLNPKADRSLLLYGYLRGSPLKPHTRIHLAGVGDFELEEVDCLTDPCPLPHQDKQQAAAAGGAGKGGSAAAAAAAAGGSGSGSGSKPRRRTLSDKERLIHAPLSDVGGMLFDRDAVYIDLPDWKVQYSQQAAAAAASRDPAAAAAAAAALAGNNRLQEGEDMVRALAVTKMAVDEKLQRSNIRLFGGSSGSNAAAMAAAGGSSGSSSEDEESEEESEQGSDEGSSEGLSDSEDEEAAAAAAAAAAAGSRKRRRLPDYETVQQQQQEEEEGGSFRLRRRALFSSSDTPADAAAAAGGMFEGGWDDDGSEEEESEEESEGLGAAAAWKRGIQQRVSSSLFAARGADLASYVYGTRAVVTASAAAAAAAGGGGFGGSEDEEEEGEEVGDDFFTLKTPAAAAAAAGLLPPPSAAAKQQQQPLNLAVEDPDGFDSSKPLLQSNSTAAAAGPGSWGLGRAAAAAAGLSGGGGGVPQGPGFSALDLDARWSDPEAVQSLRDRFVTGDWDAAAVRSAARASTAAADEEEGLGGSEEGGSDEEGDVYGDFEDVEAGVTYQGLAGADLPQGLAAAAAAGAGGDRVTAAAAAAIQAAQAEEYRQKKLAKKAAWEAGFNQRGGSGGLGEEDDDLDEEAAAAGRGPNSSTKGLGPAGKREEEGESFFDARKRELAAAAADTAAALAQMDPATRVALAGHPVGSYVRLRLNGVPYELVQHWDPTRPLLLGGLGAGETRMGVMRLRLKRHRWYPKILKTRDPLVFSVGWRRFQSLPLYALEDHNRRLRAIKYTPQHCHCLAAVYGPLAPPNTGVVAIQAAAAGPNPPSSWRIASTAVVLEQEAELRVVKKLKLVGTPLKVHKHTAFVGGMFTSQLEASRFEGAALRTVSGIRGSIKKALRAGVEGVPDGGVRVTFEDKPLLSDIVFLRAWVAVEVPKLYNTMTTLLAPAVRPRNAAAIRRKGSSSSVAGAEGSGAGADGEGGGTQLQQQQQASVVAAAAAAAAAGTAAVAASGEPFIPARVFSGARAGYVFKKGDRGVGYYSDAGPFSSSLSSSGKTAAAAAAAAAGADAAAADPNNNHISGGDPAAAAAAGAGAGGWVGMRTVAELRRAAGVGAPRQADSLYKPVERAPRVFNPLKVPTKLQAALPFKTKPKVEAPRKRKTLEAKRAVVLDKPDKQAATLLQQLNAIRNAKAEKRRTASNRRREAKAKQAAKEQETRDQITREQRKLRYVQQGKATARAAAAAEGGGKFKSKKRDSGAAGGGGGKRQKH